MKNIVKRLKEKVTDNSKLVVLKGNDTKRVVGGYSHKDHSRGGSDSGCSRPW